MKRVAPAKDDRLLRTQIEETLKVQKDLEQIHVGDYHLLDNKQNVEDDSAFDSETSMNGEHDYHTELQLLQKQMPTELRDIED